METAIVTRFWAGCFVFFSFPIDNIVLVTQGGFRSDSCRGVGYRVVKILVECDSADCPHGKSSPSARAGFVLWLVGNTPGALAVQLGFSAPGLRVHKYLLGKKIGRELGNQHNLKLAISGMSLPPTWFADQGCFNQKVLYEGSCRKLEPRVPISLYETLSTKSW